jgi:hypothetical protein
MKKTLFHLYSFGKTAYRLLLPIGKELKVSVEHAIDF